MTISSINALLEALKENMPISRVWISQTKQGGKIDAIKQLCRQNRVVFQFVPPDAINRRAGTRNQGVCAEVSPVRFLTLQEALEPSTARLILILDGVEDPGNLGAIIRTAAAVDVDAVLVSLRNAAPINDTVWRASAGALGRVKIVGSRNLAADLQVLKERGFWIVGTQLGAPLPYFQCDFRPPTALIFGSEGKGISPLLAKRADLLISIPHSAAVESLNVAAAAAIVLYEAFRQKSGLTRPPERKAGG